MSFTFSQARKLSPEETNPYNALLSRALDTFQKGVGAAYLPREKEAKIGQMQASSQKNLLLMKLLSSMMGQSDQNTQGSDEGSSSGIDSESTNFGNNRKAAIVKALTGIDPFLQSPQEKQNMQIQGTTKQAANKANLTAGASDVSREFLQDKVSMPQEYLGVTGSLTMAKDIASAKLGDEAAKERLIQAGVAEKLVPEYSGFQLMSQGQKATVTALKHQQDAIRQGWPLASKKITNNLPAAIQKEVERRHNKIVKGVNKTRESFLSSSGTKRPEFNQPANQAEQSISWADISHTAQKRGMSENEVVDKLAKKNNMTVEEFIEKIKRDE